jgi:Restriction endonuclease BglII
VKIVQKYSHQNGFEYLMYHRSDLWEEIEQCIAAVDAENCRTKQSKEARKAGQTLYAPKVLNKRFHEEFVEKRNWKSQTTRNWLSEHLDDIKKIARLPPVEQRAYLDKLGREKLATSNQTDFVKDRVAVEMQLGKYAFVAHDLFVKHMSFFLNDAIDVAVEVVPMKSMERQMSSGVPYYERDLFNLVRQGRGVPAVPIILVGIAP